jgi:glycine/D-amino acid oxidase-like deaminating enzyme
MDVIVLGAGIIGCSAAAFLAEAGAQVTVHDRSGVAAGASGRNSGVLQHPLDDRLAPWHAETVELHRQVADLPEEPDGLLILGATSTAGLPAELEPQLLDDAREAEPLVVAPMPGVLLRTGWVVGPTALTRAWWRRAEQAGARLVTGDDADLPAADLTLVATGAWTAGIVPRWGVTARVRPRFAARHVLEETAVGGISGGADDEFFTLVGDVLGTTMTAEEPERPKDVAKRLRERAKPFIGFVDVTSARACPRPWSPDGVPFVGPLDERTWVCAGHGAWGVSVGPATAKLVVEAMLDGRELPPNVHPARNLAQDP